MRYLVAFIFSVLYLYGESDLRFENTNITLTLKDKFYNYDRARFYYDYSQSSFFTTAIADIVYNSSDVFVVPISSDTPFKTQINIISKKSSTFLSKLYRLYSGYENEANRVVLGLQNISMGVGRVFNPTDLFNPKNIYAIESAERFGVFALSYSRYLNDTSDITAVVSKRADLSNKYALRYKTHLTLGDVALDFVHSNNTRMYGFEFEANLASSGIEVRSEIADISSTINKLGDSDIQEFIQVVLGADYDFVNGVNLTLESLYSSKTFLQSDLLLNYKSDIAANMLEKNFYTAMLLSYSFNIFLDASLTYIESYRGDNFIAPTLSYTLNDYNSFSLGLHYSSYDENRAFFKYTLSF